MDKIKLAVASAVRLALMKGELVSWRHEITAITDLETQVKVYPPPHQAPGKPDVEMGPRYFYVQVKEKV